MYTLFYMKCHEIIKFCFFDCDNKFLETNMNLRFRRSSINLSRRLRCLNVTYFFIILISFLICLKTLSSY